MDRQPDEAKLANLKDGYQLWREGRTGLFFLTAHSKPLGKRPEFADFLDRSAPNKADLTVIKAYIADPDCPVEAERFEVNFDLMHQAVSISKQLDLRVLVADTTDDEYAMAVAAEEGRIDYLRFRTSLREPKDEDESMVEVLYTPGAGFSLEQPTNAFCGVAEAGIEAIFGMEAPDLYNFTDAKPTREQAKAVVKRNGGSIAAYLDSFGAFKRVSHAPPKLSKIDRLLIPLRYAVTAIMLPFIFAGTVALAMSERGTRTLARDPSLWLVMLVGAAVLAVPVTVAIWVFRAVLG